MNKTIILASILAAITTIGGTIVFHLDKQNKLAEEAAAEQRKQLMIQKVEEQARIDRNNEDAQRARSVFLNRYAPSNSLNKK